MLLILGTTLLAAQVLVPPRLCPARVLAKLIDGKLAANDVREPRGSAARPPCW